MYDTVYALKQNFGIAVFMDPLFALGAIQA